MDVKRLIRYEDIRISPEINAYIDSGNAMLGVLGYTCLLYTSRCV